GAHRADEGSMQLDGQPYAPRSPLDARRLGVAMIYQELSLAPHLTVAENILLGREPCRGPFLNLAEMRRKAAEGLAAVGRADIPLNIPAGRLSIAERQLVEVARAVAIGCRVLVLDEPTSSLARHDVELLFELVRRLKSQGMSIIYISHFLEEMRAVCDRFVVLRDGASVGGGMTADVPEKRIIAMMVGRDVHDLYPRSTRKAGEVALEVEHLSGARGPRSASLSLRRGEVVGIAGLMGAGRTEMLRTIFGLESVKSGSIRIATLAGPASPAKRWAQGVGMVSEDRKIEGLALSLSVAENLALSKLPRLPSPSKLDAAARPWIDRLSIRLGRAGTSALGGRLRRTPHHGRGDRVGCGGSREIALRLFGSSSSLSRY
ncbi:MAG TPA: sugar ABC transporter ATP-binding protein, partial [Humisphaera sp.]|nr:sugar ABC transporter ATP-binding protein [Humisphaera sp.]